MKNKLSEEYINNDDTVNYNNDLNGIVQFNDTVKLENNHIIYSQNNKYISSIDEIQVTNSLYPKYNNAPKNPNIAPEAPADILSGLNNITNNDANIALNK